MYARKFLRIGDANAQSRARRFALAVAGALAVTGSADAALTGLSWETYVESEWIANGYAGLVTYRLYACFDGDPDDGVLAVYGNAGLPLSAQSTDGQFHNDALFDSMTAPVDRTGAPWFHWANQWDTYVTIGSADADGDATSLSPGFGSATNELTTDWSTENGAWFVTPLDRQGQAVDGRVLLAQFTVAAGETVSGTVNLLLWDETTTAEQLTFDTATSGDCGEDALPYSGMTSVALGDARARLDERGHLIVSNIGSSGDDGVEIRLGEASGYGMMLDDFAAPRGARRRIVLRGQVGGFAERPIATRTYEVIDPVEGRGDTGRMAVSHDASAIGVTALDVTAFDADGNRLHHTILPNGVLWVYPLLEDHDACVEYVTTSCGPGGSWCNPAPGNPTLRFIDRSSYLGEPVEFMDGTAVRGLAWIEVQAIDPPRTVDHASAVHDTGALMGEFELMESTLVQFGIQHLALGQARYGHVCSDCLVISNIGASGDDGVESRPATPRPHGRWIIIMIPTPPIFARDRLQFAATGPAIGGDDTAMGTLTIERPETELEIAADFGPIGATRMMVEIFREGALVTQSETSSGATFAVSETPDGAESSVRPPIYLLTWGGGARIRVDGTWYSGDEVRFTALDPTVELTAISHVTTTARGIEELTFLSESFEALSSACPADLDGSGAADFGDVLAILAAWGNAGGPEDLDGSGIVDFGDILAVLAAWGPCP